MKTEAISRDTYQLPVASLLAQQIDNVDTAKVNRRAEIELLERRRRRVSMTHDEACVSALHRLEHGNGMAVLDDQERLAGLDTTQVLAELCLELCNSHAFHGHSMTRNGQDDNPPKRPIRPATAGDRRVGLVQMSR
jgi:hypothetical protein